MYEEYDAQYEREYAWEQMEMGDNDDHDNFRDEDGEYDPDLVFADPGGNSALRAATPSNPRIHPCPTCRCPNKLTARDVAHGYQCDSCANALERGVDGPECDEGDEL